MIKAWRWCSWWARVLIHGDPDHGWRGPRSHKRHIRSSEGKRAATRFTPDQHKHGE